MNRTVYKIYRNGEFMSGQTWSMKTTAINIMKIEIVLEMEKMKKDYPNSQFVMDVDDEEGVGTIDEYYYDVNYEEDCWNFDVVKFEVKECVKESAV